MQEWIARLVHVRGLEWSAENAGSGSGSPALRPPATAQDIAALERSIGMPVESAYAEFLAYTDGMEHFHLNMSVLGCGDRPASAVLARAEEFLQAVLDTEVHLDEGVPEGVALVPVAVNAEASEGIFMLSPDPAVSWRFFWTGKGDAALFTSFSEVCDVASGARPWSDFATQ
ncbi:SMI1/KNR4 family protein [Streptomyces sp. NRRL B-24484]|uniref:SMI1/KNR4 family protein n=1 Tax=Streptomyces sp. NRRL B-24484 TaxID=1463833 RepID=UPI0004C01D97|nr:SMI1/KNR4 family protein [Streptomyces sp. NRRL B-24484]